jgi:hypothetical protein
MAKNRQDSDPLSVGVCRAFDRHSDRHGTTYAVSSQGRLSLDGKDALDVGELLWKGIAQGTGFLKWVMDSYPHQQHPKVWATAGTCLNYARTTMLVLKKSSERRRSGSGSPLAAGQ